MTYRLPQRDMKCTRCSLMTGQPVYGQAEVPLNEVKLIVVSAYPGKEEVKQGICLAEAPSTMNTGKFFRASIGAIFDSDVRFKDYKPFIDHVFITNVVKCLPKGDISQDHINTCGGWLRSELEALPRGIPMLLASSEAVHFFLGKDAGLYASRRQVHQVAGHPTVVTFNPVEPLKYSMKINGGRSFWMPIPVGEMRWHYLRDLELVRELVASNLLGNSTIST